MVIDKEKILIVSFILMYIGKYSFVAGIIKNWNRLPAEAIGTSPCKPKFFLKAIINGVK